MCCGRCRAGLSCAADRSSRARARSAVRALSRDTGVDHGLRRSFGDLTTPEIRQADPGLLSRLLLRRPPPHIGFGEVKSQAGLNQGLHQLQEGLNDVARRTPMDRSVVYPRVGLAWYLPNGLVRYMVAQPNVDPRLSRRVWQGNLGRIGPVPASVLQGARSAQDVLDREAHWREQQVRNLVHSVTGQPFRSLPQGHRGHDLQPLPTGSTIPGILGRIVVGANRFDDAIDAAIDAALAMD